MKESYRERLERAIKAGVERAQRKAEKATRRMAGDYRKGRTGRLFTQEERDSDRKPD